VIEVTPVAADDGAEYQAEAANVVTPRGIPKSRGAVAETPIPNINPGPNVTPGPTGGHISPSDFGSNFTTWQEVKADYDRTKSDLAACRSARPEGGVGNTVRFLFQIFG
jgi:hypothetical protein